MFLHGIPELHNEWSQVERKQWPSWRDEQDCEPDPCELGNLVKSISSGPQNCFVSATNWLKLRASILLFAKQQRRRVIKWFTQNYSKNLNILIHVMVLMANYFYQRWVSAVYPIPKVILTTWHWHSSTEVRGGFTSPPPMTEGEVILHDRRQNGFCLVFCLRHSPLGFSHHVVRKPNTHTKTICRCSCRSPCWGPDTSNKHQTCEWARVQRIPVPSCPAIPTNMDRSRNELSSWSPAQIVGSWAKWTLPFLWALKTGVFHLTVTDKWDSAF